MRYLLRSDSSRLFQLSRQCRGGICQTRGRVRDRHFSHLRLAQLHAQPESGDGSGAGNARRLRSGDLLHRRHPGPGADEVFAEILRQAGEGIGKDGGAFSVHQRHGGIVPALRGPVAGEGAEGGIGPADPFPHARHQRHQFSLRASSQRGRSGCRRSGAGVDERFHQPAQSQLDCRGAHAHAAPDGAGFGGPQ